MTFKKLIDIGGGQRLDRIILKFPFLSTKDSVKAKQRSKNKTRRRPTLQPTTQQTGTDKVKCKSTLLDLVLFTVSYNGPTIGLSLIHI